MRAVQLPPEDAVRSAAEDLLAAHRDGGPYPTVTALVSRFDINRTTFYRHFGPIAEWMLDTAQQQHHRGRKHRRPPHVGDERERTLRRLREDNENLRRHVEIYEEHIRMLTGVNSQLRKRLEEVSGVTDINSRRKP